MKIVFSSFQFKIMSKKRLLDHDENRCLVHIYDNKLHINVGLLHLNPQLFSSSVKNFILTIHTFSKLTFLVT